jgi:hypothetical protein
MTRSGVILTALLVASAGLLLRAEEQLKTLTGSCSISATTSSTAVKLRLERDNCIDGRDCGSTQTEEPLDAFLGFRLEDLKREGAHLDAMIRAEAGTLTCSGAIHDGRLRGDFRFVPDPIFVGHMVQKGYHDLDSEKLLTYTMFRIGMDWIHSLETAGVSGLESGKLIALRIFHVDADYVHSLTALGYPTPDAGKLIALKVQNVDPEEVKQIRALGYQPTLDELVEMRIFKITPDFIQRMQAKGFRNLTISKLVQVRIFQLAE